VDENRIELSESAVLTHGSTMKRHDLYIALVTGLTALVVYLLTLAPTVTSEDSGELVTAAYTFGVPHPPGFPLWCILGKLFSLIPVSNPAWRLNLMSSIFAGFTVGLIYLICIQLRATPIAAFSAALCLAFPAGSGPRPSLRKFIPSTHASSAWYCSSFSSGRKAKRTLIYIRPHSFSDSAWPTTIC